MPLHFRCGEEEQLSIHLRILCQEDLPLENWLVVFTPVCKLNVLYQLTGFFWCYFDACTFSLGNYWTFTPK